MHKKYCCVLVFSVLLVEGSGWAQESRNSGPNQLGQTMAMPGMMAGATNRAATYLLTQSSGTSHQPPAWPMPMLMSRLGTWNLMWMGQGFLAATQQSGPRGRDKLYSSNWGMLGAARRILRSRDGGVGWERTDLMGSPVRCIERIGDAWWAGTDDRGLWRSDDGHTWKRVDCPTAAVFSIAAADNWLLVGGYDGIYRRDVDDVWKRSGPRALFCCLVVDADIWVAGADPGGLWYSQDEGRSWHRTGPFLRVCVVCGPMGGGGA